MQTDCTAAPRNNVIVGKESSGQYWHIGSRRANGLMYHAKKSLMNLCASHISVRMNLLQLLSNSTDLNS